MSHVVVKFGAAWRGCTVVNCGGNGKSGKGSCAQDLFASKVEVFVANYVTDVARSCAFNGVVFHHPSFCRESINIGRGGRLWMALSGHDFTGCEDKECG